MYEYISDDEHSYTLKGKDGKEFKVAKQSISDAIHGKITNMKPVKMAKGGEVPAALDPNYDVNKMLTPNLNQEASAYPDPVAVAYENRLKNSKLEKEDLQNKDINPFPTPEDFMSPNQIDINAQKDALNYANLHKQKLESGAYTSPNPDSIGQQQARLDEQKQNLGVGGFKQPQLETPEMALQKQLQAQSQMPEMGKNSQNMVNLPQSHTLGLMEGYKAPLMANAKIQEDMYKQQADIYGKMAAQADEFKLQAEAQQKAKQKVGEEYDKLFNDVRDQKVDPYKVWNDSSTGQKAGIVVGMLLSGIGQGLQGPGATNMAMDAYNKQVDRSIEAQKMELGKKENLLSVNLRKYGDLQTAEAATRAAYLTALGAKVSQAAAMAQSAEAKNNAKLTDMQIKMQMAPLLYQIQGMMAKAMVYGKAGGGAGGIPVNQEPYQLLADPDYAKKRIVVDGKVYQATDDESAKTLRNLQSEYEPVKKMVGELNSLVGNPAALTKGTNENLRATALRSYLIPRINAMHGLTRLSEEDIKTMGQQLSDPTAFTEFLNGKAKNEQFFKNLNDDLNENYKTRLINFGGMAGQGFQPLGKAKGR